MDEEAIRQKARERIQSGRLSRTESIRAWAGPGIGQPCVVCDEPITDRETEFELQFQEGRTGLQGYRFHRFCQGGLGDGAAPDLSRGRVGRPGKPAARASAARRP